MDMYELYYRFRKSYERGGPWVYIRTYVLTTRTDKSEMERGILSHLSDAEIISLRKLYHAGTIVLTGDSHFGKVVTAGEAKQARVDESFRQAAREREEATA